MEQKEENKLEFHGEIKAVIDNLRSGKKMIAMVAPSFVIDFDYKTFADTLRAMGFCSVTELTFGAKEVNRFYTNYIKQNPNKLHISSPCPVITKLIVNKYPQLKDNLIPCVSPMVAMARILKKECPELMRVFIGPCFAKKQEAKYYSEDIDLALTYKDIDKVIKFFKKANLMKPKEKKNYFFDRFYDDATKIYPVSGGLAKSMHAREIVGEDEFIIADGTKEVLKILDELNLDEDKTNFVDILSCNGGCIGGPGVISTEPIPDRKKKVLEYMEYAKSNKTGERVGLDKYVETIDFSAKPFI
ncbi:[Fe-Fe] hydrogenase large subunit C-terminal domain-containing protein [Nanoarchaeota archaeon]